ncbi:fibronectin type III domain-containing protein [Levilactobacillus lanxiensis]|uniref:Fibronectin type III domain-containing protein n=1 Tax=Levilactobacillus lanxiensis TaxID=2799568 RepID=A0ABW4D5T2_9LACO|nr:fibronectin type III domain-containing protein [Levilactobacillus lanxiensis]
MAKWNQLVITDAGYQLSAKTLAGTKIQYTHAQTTDKDMSDLTSDELKSVTKLDSVVQDLSVGIITVQDDHTVNIPVKVSNQDVTADYLLCGLAIFAKPVDGDEILYGIATAVSPDLMVAQNGSTVVGTNFKLKVHVGSAANVNIVISPDGSVSNEELEGILKDYVLTSELSKKLPEGIVTEGGNNVMTGSNVFKADPVDADGNAYVTGSGAVAAAEGHFAQASKSGGVTISGVELEVDDAGKLKYGDDLVLMANKPQAPGFTAAMDFSVGQPEWTVTLPKIDGGASIVSSTVQYRKSGDTDWTSIQSAVSVLSGHVTGLTGNSEYEFRAFVSNYAGDSPYSNTETVKTMDDRIFGVSWDMSSDPKLTRTDAAVGLVAGINGSQNDFDTVGPWAKMDKTITDDKGNSFVRIPKLYIKKTQTDKLATWQVSLSKIDDTWYLPKCFWDFTNQKELDYVDVGRYEGTISSGKLKSNSGVMATVSQPIGTFRTDAKANGTGYQLLDVHVIDVWQVLFVIEFATINSQSIMNGISSGSQVKNGSGTNHAGSSGFLSPTGAMDYRGIENLYGNIFQFADGVNMASKKPWVCDDSSKYQSDLFAAPYTSLNYSVAESGYSERMGLDTNHPFAQFATKTGDSESTYYSDYNYTPSGNCVALYGGNWNGSGYDGVFCWHLYESSSYLNSGIGSRLVKKALA